jgi:mannosyltransferase OCH1-like enzyme
VARVRDPARLPKRVFLFWDRGLAAAPDIVRFCVASWTDMNPGWDVVLLDGAAAHRVLPRAGLRADISVNHYSDILRTELLVREGGVWADATCLCAAPLDHWIGMVFQQADVFAFDRPGRDRAVSTWFLASVPRAPLMCRWNEDQKAYWAPPRRAAPPYYASHALFEHLVRFDPRMRSAWAEVPKISAEPPHRLQRVLAAGRAATPEDLGIIRASPVHKLTWKQDLRVADVIAALAAARATSADATRGAAA